jgi:hypothetical protein
MIRFATFCWLAIWSASLAAETVKPLVESDAQRLKFSQTMVDVHGPASGQNTAHWGGKSGTFGDRKKGLASIGWYPYLTPRDYQDAPYHTDLQETDSQVFDRSLTPGLSFNWSGSSVALYRNGLRYQAEDSPWFFNVSHRNLNRASKLTVQSDPDATKVKALILEIGVDF